MFITNGYQALIDYRPSCETLFASTLRDKKSKPSFEPSGRVVITLAGHFWVLDIVSSHDNRLLVMALIKHFIFRNSEMLICPLAVEKALSQISDHGVVVRKLSEIKESPDSFIYDFKFDYTLRKLSMKPDEVISTIIYSLKSYDKRITNLTGLTREDFSYNQVEFTSEDIFTYHSSGRKTLIFKIDDEVFLTNIADTTDNQTLLRAAVSCVKGIREGFQSYSKSFTHVCVHSLAILVKGKTKIRPAMFVSRDDGKVALFHRPFLSTEKNFEKVPRGLQEAAIFLGQVSQ